MRLTEFTRREDCQLTVLIDTYPTDRPNELAHAIIVCHFWRATCAPHIPMVKICDSSLCEIDTMLNKGIERDAHVHSIDIYGAKRTTSISHTEKQTEYSIYFRFEVRKLK